MSLLPVAEAFQLLESEGLVESRPRVGTRVCLPSAEDIRERYEIREALETQSARLFAQRASTRDRLDLERMAEDMDAMFNRCAATPRQRSRFPVCRTYLSHAVPSEDRRSHRLPGAWRDH